MRPLFDEGRLAQLVERLPYKQNVGGSTPSAPTREKSFYRCGAVVQLVRIPACHAGGRGFESRPLRQQYLLPSSKILPIRQIFQISEKIAITHALCKTVAFRPLCVINCCYPVQFESVADSNKIGLEHIQPCLSQHRPFQAPLRSSLSSLPFTVAH